MHKGKHTKPCRKDIVQSSLPSRREKDINKTIFQGLRSVYMYLQIRTFSQISQPLRASFSNDFYRLNNSHVSRSQLRQVLTTAGVLLSEEEMFALETRYNDDSGFNYNWFLKELYSLPVEEPLYHSMMEQRKRVNAARPTPEPTVDETNIVLILAKIKAKVVQERVKV